MTNINTGAPHLYTFAEMGCPAQYVNSTTMPQAPAAPTEQTAPQQAKGDTFTILGKQINKKKAIGTGATIATLATLALITLYANSRGKKINEYMAGTEHVDLHKGLKGTLLNLKDGFVSIFKKGSEKEAYRNIKKADNMQEAIRTGLHNKAVAVLGTRIEGQGYEKTTALQMQHYIVDLDDENIIPFNNDSIIGDFFGGLDGKTPQEIAQIKGRIDQIKTTFSAEEISKLESDHTTAGTQHFAYWLLSGDNDQIEVIKSYMATINPPTP